MGTFAEFCKGKTMGAFFFLLLVDDDESALVPVQQLDAVAALVAKHEDMAGQRIALQVLADLLGQAIEAAAEIDRLAAEPDADGGRKAQPGGASSRTASSCRNVGASKPGATRRRRPPAAGEHHFEGVVGDALRLGVNLDCQERRDHGLALAQFAAPGIEAAFGESMPVAEVADL